jgi:hypothetical protein
MAEANYKSSLGISLYVDPDGITITGNAKRSETIVEFESAYDFEEFVQKHIDCTDISFDSEFCQFFAYAKTEERALKFVNDIEKHFDKVKKMLD